MEVELYSEALSKFIGFTSLRLDEDDLPVDGSPQFSIRSGNK
jgi:hypothetical protein